ncbi:MULTISPECIES: putative oxidoreductase C-terminal domain-containing protein [Niastella]|uniref:Gfo/Idh/MocA family oxidoreductase n=1 Tax=Niastella soli TaxID=2821487 RepID=A0ABS3YYK1_9BACT|nr:putative oxidoreductase C-terminal domain-containing protein [Niastella soli]MBO9202495.1 Gfo/Idh/MocA family oxidoreductase [Niastella soli]
MKRLTGLLILFSMMVSCGDQPTQSQKSIRLITLDPGHFHAALVQKTMYEDVDSVVQVYAPGGRDLQLHLDKINAYNTRKDNPTTWKSEVYTGNDFFEKMVADKKGNVVVLSGNNQKKADYILKSLQSGFNVFADKPMAINGSQFEQLKLAFDAADKNKLLLYDIMTERFEITNRLLRELSQDPEIFGTLVKGTVADPAVVKTSIHYFYKFVSGNVLTRPEWFFDASQQGEGIADVMTHLVDLVQWECFPEQTIDYLKDLQLDSAKRWTTDLSLNQFKTLTKANAFPAYLKSSAVNDTLLKIFYNGEINYTIKGVHAKTTALWDYQAPAGGDNYYAQMKGTKARLVIRQGNAEKYKPVLYLEPVDKNFNPIEAFKKVQAKFPGIELVKATNGWQVVTDKYSEGHEEHFARVTQNFLQYLKNKNMPSWEVPNMLAKYFVTTKALELASKR